MFYVWQRMREDKPREVRRGPYTLCSVWTSPVGHVDPLNFLSREMPGQVCRLLVLILHQCQECILGEQDLK